MTRVGIMSMQRIYNYGSSLQAYGLRRLIEDVAEDVEVSFVDYVPGPVLVDDGGSSAGRSRLRRAVTKVTEYNQVDARLRDKLRFFNHKRTYGKRFFPLLDIPRRLNHDLDVDVQVIGSDEVFNCVQSNTNVGFAPDLFGRGSPAARVISYAGSFGNTTLEKIDSFGLTQHLRADFARFSAISVRDDNSAQIIQTLTGKAPARHVDPALAYDFMAAESQIPKERLARGKYIIVYGYSGRLDHEENEAIRHYARATGARVLSFGGVQECCDEFIDCNPFELLAYFRDAEAVITDTFHGTIFAIINARPFAAIVRRSSGSGYGNEEKLGSLLATFGLTSQAITEVSRIGDTLGNDIDGHTVQAVLATERVRSREYLASAVLEGAAT